ncbi:MAG: glutaconate CoA-transferase [Syntrophales bacterium]|nr:glutaconate CoA-transferase [Syntrophales bacterium]
MTYAKEYTTTEMMGATVARQVRDDDVVFIGIGLPLIAGVAAVNTHAPGAILIYEGGGIGARSRRLPWSIADNPTTDNALAAAPMWRVLSDLQRGFVTLGILGGAEIDRFGNLNTTVIPGDGGSYAHPKVRLPGSGGANDIASSARRTVIMMRLQKGKFVEHVQHITTAGYLNGPGEREKAGLRGGGPVTVITDRCVFNFDEDTKEMYLHSLFPGATVDDIRQRVDWELKVAPDLSEVEPPTEELVQVMRALDPMGIVLGKKSTGTRPETFDTYYETMKAAYETIRVDL